MPRDSSLRSEPLDAKIYAKKAAFADFVRFGGEPLASLADVGCSVCDNWMHQIDLIYFNLDTLDQMICDFADVLQINMSTVGLLRTA